MTIYNILQYVKIKTHLEHKYILVELDSNKHAEKISKPACEDNENERFDMHERFGRKARRMSGMAASLLRAKTFQDTQDQAAGESIVAFPEFQPVQTTVESLR